MENDQNHRISPLRTKFDSVAIVVPMYNEIESVPLLSYRLKGVLRILSGQIKSYLLVVDDGSTDMTFQEMRAHFEDADNFHLLRHGQNKGFSQALRTGIEKALDLNVDLIVTIDADTNYDHFYIPLFVDNFTEDCDLMTASPWHPEGQRKYFPAHRLILSLGVSFLYRNILRKYDQPLYTYSACFRIAKADVYRKIKWNGEGFLATSEIMARCIVNGMRIKEYPFHVNPRIFGLSKMRKIRQIYGHLAFMWQLWRNPEFLKIPDNPDNSSDEAAGNA